MPSADVVYRDYVIDGVPASGPHKPAKADIRALFQSLVGGVSLPPPLSTLGALDAGGVNTASNTAAFALAEASSEPVYAIGAGSYATTRAKEDLNRGYVGRGVILEAGGWALPANFSYMKVKPTVPVSLGNSGWFTGDKRFTDGGEWKIIGPDVREYDLTARYYEPTAIPHHAWMFIQSGNSGKVAHLVGAVVAGATTATLNGAYAGMVGKTLGFVDGSGVVNDQVVVSAVNTGTDVVTFAPPLANNHANLSTVMTAGRTWNGHTYIRVQHEGGGDGYGHIVRMVVKYPMKPGQDHFFYGATGGLYGGETYIQEDGNYATGWESQGWDDKGGGLYADGSYIAQVDSFVRGNDTGAYGNVWLGTLFKSEGAKPADAAHVVAGKWRVALDTVRADLSNFAAPGDNKNIAINTALGHKWVMNSTASLGGRGGHSVIGTFFGNTPGDMLIESGNDGVTDFIALRFAGSAGVRDARIRIRPTAVQINVGLTVAGSVISGADMGIATGSRLYIGPGAWITWSGSDIVKTINNGASYTSI